MSGIGRAQLPDAPAPGMFQVLFLNDTGHGRSHPQIRNYKRRRPHKKSRGGCQACKQRRVKCDQTTPSCLRCRRNQRDCVYEGGSGGEGAPSGPGSRAHQALDGSQPGLVAYPEASSSSASASAGGSPYTAFAVDSQTEAEAAEPVSGPGFARPAAAGYRYTAATAVSPPWPTRNLCPPAPPPLMGLNEYGTPSVELLHHVETAGRLIFSMSDFIGPVIPLALHYPHLRGTLLAVAASHLSHKAPGCTGYHVAKHYQQAVALEAYQAALSTPLATQGQGGVDALLITAMLMNLLSFVLPMDESEALKVWDGHNGERREHGMDGSRRMQPPPCVDPDPDPRRSWVFSPNPNRLGWLALQMGLTPLLIATAPWRSRSRLRLLFANSDDERRTLSGTWQSLRRVPRTWLRLFGLDSESTPNPSYRGSGVTTPAAAAAATPSTLSDTHMSRSSSSSSSSASGSGSGSRSGSRSGSAGSSPEGSAAVTVISEADRLYRAPLRVVAELRLMEPHPRNLLQYFQFIGQLDNEFRYKLLERDEKALWLFGMWMGLLCRYGDVWWTRRRTRCDFRAIRLWLHLVGVARRPGEEGRLWRELLQDLDDTWGYDFDADPLVQGV